jgi:hypothetical protein
MVFHLSILNVNRFYTDLIRSTYKIGTTIRPEDLGWSSNSRDTTQCIDKARTTHLFYQFNVYSTSGQTWKNDRPSFTLSSSTTCPASGDIPWTKGVHSNSRKWWPRSKTVLDFNLSTKFATQHTSPDECRNEPLSSNDPETI